MARGNFEISTIWKNGKAISFEIKSNKGGVCRIKYPAIGNATLKSDSGETIHYVAEGLDVISFETNNNERYFIRFNDE